jgi:hypothetical protein
LFLKYAQCDNNIYLLTYSYFPFNYYLINYNNSFLFHNMHIFFNNLLQKLHNNNINDNEILYKNKKKIIFDKIPNFYQFYSQTLYNIDVNKYIYYK